MKQLQEQRVREIVQEELKKREATAITIAPNITLSSDVSVEKIAEKINSELEKATEELERSYT
ncbi:hypothetical protein [Paenibacillus larvae]|uniref:Uncharacterized protein n=1 Tax=Paenibacillus larvae subsp. larvae TaxID=147375 RepID=A0A2L1U3T1_9BACL|nr:hypothetical protein [Paenibacillus larvae]AQZ45597.1 hypothetical protein B5S25_02270 [Paenibacillus larvae subsp. pulvifaciens]AVF27603.1 hypothetical protein ERICIII_03493 [Paenibacillus larvae subsp. larvae]MBH0344661.1 hypothetical protein [Paenibacillus larvae]MDR5608538.1 hypothetical protein [Paenibacillus larvae]